MKKESPVGTLWQDIRYGIRMLRTHRGFTAVAVLTLALSIGANTTIFTLIHTLLLRSLPVADPQRLVYVADPSGRTLSLCYPHYQRFRRESQSFAGLFAADGIRNPRLLVAGSGGQVESVQAQAVTANFFDVLGVRLAVGRGLMPADDRSQEPQAVAVVSYGFWQRRFGVDPTVIGSTIVLDGIPFSIGGVAPRGFFGVEVGRSPDVWWPLEMAPAVNGKQDALTSYSTWLQVMGRLKAGTTREQATAELDTLYHRILDEESVGWRLSEEQRRKRLARSIELQAGAAGWTELRSEFRRPLLVVMGMVILLLLIACANLTGLHVARGAARQHELRVRTALGARRWALARQLMVESLLLATTGGILGLFVAQWGVHLLAGCLPGYGDRVVLRLTPDLRILTFAFFISAATGVLCGIIPACRGSRVDLASDLRNRTSGLVGSRQRWNQGLVVAQIALSCCLLIGAGLFVRTVQKLTSLDLGFDREHLLVFELDAGRNYDHTRWVDLCRGVRQQVGRLPGVVSTSHSSGRALTGADSGWGPRKVAVYGTAPSEEEGLEVANVGVAPGYFKTMGIPLLSGRDFGPQDEPAPGSDPMKQTVRPVIIDETGARRLFGNGNPVGGLLQPIGLFPGQAWSALEVIGVAKDTIHKDLREGPLITLYGLEALYHQQLVFFYVRTLGDPLALAGGIRQVLRALDPKVALTGLRTVEDLLDEQLFRERLTSELAGLFSLSALLLACLGLYGTLSYAVVRRTREIGVRMALGAEKHNVLAAVIRQGMTLTLIGCSVGLALAIASTRIVSSLLYGVTPTDPLTFIATALLLGTVALVSCWLPARRAARIDPMVALRYE